MLYIIKGEVTLSEKLLERIFLKK